MNIAVLSGKGGTGKTFVSCNLASAIGKSAYIDCDVGRTKRTFIL